MSSATSAAVYGFEERLQLMGSLSNYAGSEFFPVLGNHSLPTGETNSPNLMLRGGAGGESCWVTQRTSDKNNAVVLNQPRAP